MLRIRLFALTSCFACVLAAAGCSEKRSVAPLDAGAATPAAAPAAAPADEGAPETEETSE
ncbi:MAG: hypothetical protein NXI04_29720 [Planctomycetaceae bacterium]|nr:hypothetical protein [Planctomycetaceae bacterium]